MKEQRKKTNQIGAIEESYKKHVTDEFLSPLTLISDGARSGDGFFITNFRADRVRELLSAIFDEDFDFLHRKYKPVFFDPISMIEYSKRLKKKN